MKLKRGLAAGYLAVWAAIAPGPSGACEMPDQLIIKQTVLNITYPDALFVNGATWEMQQAGLLEMPDRERLTATGKLFDDLERAALAETLAALASLGNALHAASTRPHALSIVLVERVHWERFMPEPDKGYDPLETRCYLPCDIKRERASDLVLVTSEPALHAIRDGLLPISQAIKLGLLRTYGNDVQMAAFLEDFGAIGTHPFKTHAPLNFAGHDPLSQYPESFGRQASREFLSP